MIDLDFEREGRPDFGGRSFAEEALVRLKGSGVPIAQFGLFGFSAAVGLVMKGAAKDFGAENIPIIAGVKDMQVPNLVDHIGRGDGVASCEGKEEEAAVFANGQTGEGGGPAIFAGGFAQEDTVVWGGGEPCVDHPFELFVLFWRSHRLSYQNKRIFPGRLHGGGAIFSPQAAAFKESTNQESTNEGSEEENANPIAALDQDDKRGSGNLGETSEPRAAIRFVDFRGGIEMEAGAGAAFERHFAGDGNGRIASTELGMEPNDPLDRCARGDFLAGEFVPTAEEDGFLARVVELEALAFGGIGFEHEAEDA